MDYYMPTTIYKKIIVQQLQLSVYDSHLIIKNLEIRRNLVNNKNPSHRRMANKP